MQSFTSRADELYIEASQVQIPDYIPPYTSCYESLWEEENLIQRAREMESQAREIRSQFQSIAESGFPVPNTSLLRKAVISVKKGKLMFSAEQLNRVAKMIMSKKPYLLFRPKAETKSYVILIFWSTSIDDTECAIQQQAEIVKQEVAVDHFQLRFKVENIASPRRNLLYLVNNFIILSTQNDDECHLPPEDHKQLIEFFQLLQEQNIIAESSKKRKVSSYDNYQA